MNHEGAGSTEQLWTALKHLRGVLLQPARDHLDLADVGYGMLDTQTRSRGCDLTQVAHVNAMAVHGLHQGFPVDACRYATVDVSYEGRDRIFAEELAKGEDVCFASLHLHTQSVSQPYAVLYLYPVFECIGDVEVWDGRHLNKAESNVHKPPPA